MKQITRLCLLVVFLFLSPKVVYTLNLPNYSARVNDFAGIYSPEFENQLENRLAKIETDTTNEVAVVSINSLEGTTIEDYSEQLFQYWGIGKKNQDNGLLLLIAPNEREVRIEVGYGLEPVITDGRAGEIIRNQITPAFKAGNYEKGTWDAVEKINQYLSDPVTAQDNSTPTVRQILDVVNKYIEFIFIILLVFTYLVSYMARTSEFFMGGIFGTIIGLIIGFLFSLAAAFIIAIIAGIFGLILDFILSRNYQRLKKMGKDTSFWSSKGGFGGGPWSRGGGGFGGFGGGSSGGGGASGKW